MAYRVAVLVSGEGTNLQALLDSVHGRAGIELTCVAASRSEARALGRAARAAIEHAVFAIAAHRDREERDRALADWLAERADLLVLAGWMEILGPDFIHRFERRIVNVHPSLLPAFPGVRAIEQALGYGVKVTGVTVHFVDQGVDSGPIILQEPLDVSYCRDVAEVEERLHEIEHRLLPHAVRLLATGAVRLDPDNPRLVHVDHG